MRAEIVTIKLVLCHAKILYSVVKSEDNTEGYRVQGYKKNSICFSKFWGTSNASEILISNEKRCK